METLSVAFAAIRAVYVAAYLMNLGTLRILVRTDGFATRIATMAMS